ITLHHIVDALLAQRQNGTVEVAYLGIEAQSHAAEFLADPVELALELALQAGCDDHALSAYFALIKFPKGFQGQTFGAHIQAGKITDNEIAQVNADAGNLPFSTIELMPESTLYILEACHLFAQLLIVFHGNWQFFVQYVENDAFACLFDDGCRAATTFDLRGSGLLQASDMR
ncbi:hypothetical protein DT376_35250, partial [Pseudomonas aeruginosa]